MLDHIPLEIQSEIMKRLPVKSLIQFRSVCKSWKSLIGSPDFIAHYSSQQQHLLVRYTVNYEAKYVTIDDDEHIVSVTLPPLVNKLRTIVGSSHGLLCFFGDVQELTEIGSAVIWNPCIRKAVHVDVPRVKFDNTYRTLLGFGVCPETIDPKIVKITHCVDMESVTFIPWQVEVFTLNTRAWRSPYSSNLPRKSIYVDSDQVVVDGCLYWLATDRIALDDGTFRSYNLIVSFDLITEEFREVNLPGRLAGTSCRFSMYKLGESIAVLELGVEANKLVYRVWMMEDGVTKSFYNLFSFNSHSRDPDVSIICVCGFRKTDEALIELYDRPSSTRILAAYDPYSETINDILIYGRHSSYSVYYCMETLLLL
ncbi:putative F-box domain-containing protein [Helianthus annuus]|nr:putative F-box domain-containing protein [Helianthus annuus]